MKFNKDWLKKRWVAYTVATCSAVVLYLLLSHIGLYVKWFQTFYGYVSTVVLGIVIAYILDPFVNIVKKYLLKGIKKEKLKHSLAVAIVVIVLLALLVLIVLTLVPQLVDSLVTFASNIKIYTSKLKALMNTFTSSKQMQNFDFTAIMNKINDFLADMTDFVSDNAGNILNKSLC